jgi:hypothetical protein
MSSLPLGNSADLTGFSPADFADATETIPLEIQFDPTRTGTLIPYSTLVSNAFQRTTLEIREKTTNPSPTPTNWRRRFREFMTLKNEDLVNFLKKPTGPQSALSRAEVFLQKFGKPDFQANHPSLQYIFLDASGSSYIPVIESDLKQIGPSTPKEIIDQVRWLYDRYREAGDECLRLEANLKARLEIFDKVYQKVISFCELPQNEESEKLAESVEGYIKKTLEEHAIENAYKETVEAYRRFAALKELVQSFRFTDLQDKEPLCSICLTETVGFATVPCGHTFCGTCLKRQTMSCYMCRTQIRDKVKLFFG